MEPWVHTDKNGLSSAGAALTERAFGSWLCIRWKSVALVGLFYVFTTNQLLGYFDGLALACP